MQNKHRKTVFTVVRELLCIGSAHWYEFDALVGTYATAERAEEVAGSALQAFKDVGMNDGEYRFTVHPVTYYDE